MAGQSQTTTDHTVIQEWVEERDGVPAVISDTENRQEGAGLLRIHFPDYSQDDEEFDEISWEEFFDTFEKKKLAFLYQEETKDNEPSRFFKFVSRDRT